MSFAALWSQPETRKALLEALGEKGFGGEQLAEIGRMINAEKSDVFDVLAYIAFATPPITRQERVDERRPFIMSAQDARLAAFIDFVMGQYVREGVGELDRDKLAPLLTLKYRSVADAVAELGGVTAINDAFLSSQKTLFS